MAVKKKDVEDIVEAVGAKKIWTQQRIVSHA